MTGVRSNYILTAIVILALALRIYVSGGVTPADDSTLVSLALRWLEEGPYLPSTHYELRVGLTLPLALIFAVFGVGEWQVAFLPLAASAGGVVLAYLFAKNLYGVPSGLIAAAAVAVFPLDVYFGSLFFPDAIFGTVAALGVYLVWRAPYKQRPYLWAIASGLVWGFDYLIKVEAFFVGFAYLALFLDRRYRLWVVIAAAACLSVVVAENIVYRIASGQWLHHLNVLSTSYAEASATIDTTARRWELLAFPKAWFVTIYNPGLNYYFMFFGLALLIKRRAEGAVMLSFWIGAILLWLQFGGSFHDGQYLMKTKLERYTLYVTVPMGVVIGYAIAYFPVPRFLQQQQTNVRVGLLLLLGSVGMFFSHFSILNTEREVSIKRALQEAKNRNLPKLYMDSGTFSIAELKAKMRGVEFQGERLEKLDLTEQSLDQDNYVMINKSLVEFRNWRYGLNIINYEQLEQCAQRVAKIRNPLPRLAYIQIRLLRTISAPIPVLGDKIKHTADGILDPHDVLIYRMDADARQCLLRLRTGSAHAIRGNHTGFPGHKSFIKRHERHFLYQDARVG